MATTFDKNREFDGYKLYNGDFRRYYDLTQKRNIWVLGYFGGGSVSITRAMEIAKDYAQATGVSLNSVKIDEIFNSRRFKGFKYVFSTEEQKQVEGDDVDVNENVWRWLND